MRKFIVKILLFSAIIIGALVVVELCLMHTPNDISDRVRYLTTHSEEVSTLILGNSQIATGLNPVLLNDSAYNDAFLAKSAYYNYWELQEMVEGLKNLKCVIWNLSYFYNVSDLHLFYSYKRKYDNLVRCRYYKYLGIEPAGGWPHEILWWETIWTQQEGAVMMRLFQGLGAEPDYSKKGWKPYMIKDRWPNWKEINAYSTRADFHSKKTTDMRDFNIHYAAKIAELCSERRLRLIVVTLPSHLSSKKYYCKDGFDEMRMCVDSMKKAYPEMEYYDYLTDERFIDDDYFDCTHLNESGGIKFTEIFKEEVFDRKE